MALSDTPGGASHFRLSQLLTDRRYRSTTLQIVAAVLILAFFYWLVDNTSRNLDDLGKSFSFNFLGTIAGYDINQRLIDYNGEINTHLRAAMVGLLNTLLVAFMGCVAATVIGVLVGIARLSKNKPLARLARMFVEIFRNIPLLLWLLLIFAVLSEALPSPAEFRGDAPKATMALWDSVAVTNRGTYLPAVSFAQPGAIWALLLAVAIGLGGAVGFRRWADARQQTTGVRPHTLLFVIGVWIVALVAAISWGQPSVDYPGLKGFNFQGGLHIRNSLIALWLALSLYTAAFIAETVRSGIEAISKGQKEASAALGFSGGLTMRLVVLPQALRVIIPPLISSYLNLTKNSSLAIAIGYMDITGTLMGITLNQTGRELEAVLLAMLIYLLISLTISLVLNIYNSRVQLKER